MSVHPKLAGRSCYHKYEVEAGLFTPGQFLEVNPKLCLDELVIPQSLLGLRALDIGAWDGPYTFELERRGAQVTALDIQDPNITVFNAVKEIKSSTAKYVRGSVYEASPEELGVYDMVLFAGVYYHLKNPVLALQRIRKLLNDGGVLFIEGASATDYLAQGLNNDLGLPESRMRTIRDILDRLPLSYFDFEDRIYPGGQNWWFPTTRCLEMILLDSGFRNVALKLELNAMNNYTDRRLMGRAEVNPANSDPGNQKRGHWVFEQDFPILNKLATGRPRSAPGVARRLFWKLPPGLQWTARRVRRALRPSS
jgi:tRNA (mo5U34)-methyltransferase